MKFFVLLVLLVSAFAIPVAGANASAKPGNAWIQEPAPMELEFAFPGSHDRSPLWCDPQSRTFGAKEGLIPRVDATLRDPKGVNTGVENSFYLFFMDQPEGIRVTPDLRLIAFDRRGSLEIGRVRIEFLPAPATNPDGVYCAPPVVELAPGIRSRLEIRFLESCRSSLGIWRPIDQWRLRWGRQVLPVLAYTDGQTTVTLTGDRESPQFWDFGEGLKAHARCLNSYSW